MAAYDGGRTPEPNKDPNKETQWEVRGVADDIGKAILQAIAGLTDAAKKALEELIKEVVDKIVGYVTNPLTFLTDLAQWSQRVPLLSELTNLLLGSWIPGLDASKITSGAFPLAMIQGLLDNGGKIVTGLLNVPVSVITGLFTVGGQILSGLIGGLDASKIISGQFPQSMISGLTAFLNAIPGGNIIGTLLSSVIPGLDASKITSGAFNLAQLPTQVLTTITGVASSLLNGILGTGLIPGLDASKITSGTFNLSMITGLLDGGGKILTSILNVPSSIITGLFQAGGTILSNLIPGLDASKITSGTFGQSFVTGLTDGLNNLNSGLQGAVNGIVNGLKNLNGQYWTQADATLALKQQAAAVAAAAAAVAALQGENDANPGGGINYFVDFSTFPDSMQLPSSVFTEYYQGGSASTAAWGISGGKAVVTQNEDFYFRKFAFGQYNLGTTLTDYQRVVGVWDGAPGVGYQNPTPFFTPVPYYNPFVSEHILFFRWKDINNHCRVRFAGDAIGMPGTAYVEAVVNGTVTLLTSFGHVFQANTAYYVDAGLGGGLRIFRVWQGTMPIATITDSGNISGLGAGFRGGGPAVVFQGAQGVSLPANPAGLVAWGMSDNNPNNLTLGKQARFYRASTTALGVSTGNPTLVPNNFWDTVDYNVGGIFVWTPGQNCKVQVLEKGLYQVNVRSGWNAGNLIDTHLWKGSGNGAASVHKEGMTFQWTAGSTFNVNLAANDFIQIAMKSNGGGANGNAAGTGNYLEIRQVLSGA